MLKRWEWGCGWEESEGEAEEWILEGDGVSTGLERCSPITKVDRTAKMIQSLKFF